MACTKYYFSRDYYGIGFYEEEVTTEPQQGGAAKSNASRSEEVAGILEELGHFNAVTDHNYIREVKNSIRGKSREPARGRREPVFRKPTTCCRKQNKLTPEQTVELDRVFEETHYPDALQRKELAELLNVEECTVKVWFNNRRAKLRKHQKALLRKSIIPSKQNHFSNLKILTETKNVVVLQEPLWDEVFCYRPHAGHPNWQ
ncbi:rhox homeobox family member 1-like [Mesocricetus auratus]|uniref:Rhox homeobox family member 1-like n=1 Tax=Mesocricetus auratus TaxID=10036 RepID=A0A3Q0DC31_MESAU|nr:rhox homeobox family member 1-like [Mesocricetus auratus]